LVLPQIYNLDAYVRSVRDLVLLEQQGCGEVILDFSGTDRAYPDGVAPLVATVMRLRKETGLAVTMEPPTNRALRGVFEAVGWTRYLTAESPSFEPPPVFTGRFTPLCPFGSALEVDRLHRSIMEVLVTQARLATWLPEAIQWALWEIMENVLIHAQVANGWVQASTFPKTRHINIVVVDTGVGIRGSLSQRDPRMTDREAIRLAVEKGVTRDPAVGAGYGLAGCRQIVRLNKGEMIVYTGGWRLVQEALGRKEEDQLRYGPTQAHHKGTIVELELRTDRPIDLAAALGQRRPTTLLELKHDTGSEFRFDVGLEASNVGTREAGRELRNKVLNLSQSEAEERVVLDFRRVDMLSSSFADEFVAKLAQELGKKGFFDKFDLRGMNASVKTIVHTALWDRLK